jgi:hypothetical protein
MTVSAHRGASGAPRMEPPGYRPGVSLESAAVSSCDGAVSTPGSDALSILVAVLLSPETKGKVLIADLTVA